MHLLIYVPAINLISKNKEVVYKFRKQQIVVKFLTSKALKRSGTAGKIIGLKSMAPLISKKEQYHVRACIFGISEVLCL